MSLIKDLNYYLEGINSGNRFILGEAITLVESKHPEKKDLGLQVMENLKSSENKSIRIGITGSPGVGKSTFLDAFGSYLTQLGKKVAVLAIDPSSRKTKGSILGDKTRMERLSKDPRAFIRPTASGLLLGGVASNTREVISLCESAGYEIILVETVGVGQSETMVSSVVDLFSLLILPGSGDDIQGIKRGIMELADIIVINKADGDRIPLAEESKRQFNNALSLMHGKFEGWKAKVVTCSSIEETGIEKVWETMTSFINISKEAGFFEDNRRQQAISWYEEKVKTLVFQFYLKNNKKSEYLLELRNKVVAAEIDPVAAIRKLTKELDEA